MTVVTRQQRNVSPIPPGRYWLTLVGPVNVREFDQWVADMGGAVRIESSELEPQARSEFVIFNVPAGRSPFLNAGQFGFPNTAPAEVKGSQDVEQVPILPEPGFPDFSAPFAIGGGLVALVVVALLLGGMPSLGGSSSRRRRYA